MFRFYRLAGFASLAVGVAGFAFGVIAPSVPEIDAASGMNVLCLLLGALLVMRSRRR